MVRARVLAVAAACVSLIASGAQAGAAGAPAVAGVVRGFMFSRLAAAPVEDFLAPQALTAYRAHARGLWLYDESLPGGPGANYERFAIRPPRILSGRPGSWRVEVRIGVSWVGDAPPGELVEILRVGPGRPASGRTAALVVLAAARRPSAGGLPVAVARTRSRIYRAAVAQDARALRALVGRGGFTYSFGESGDPIGYWQRLEANEVPVLGDILPGVLHTRFARRGDIYVWPSAAAKAPRDWTAADIAALRRLATDAEIRGYRRAGGYLGWRVGIRREGSWRYFVAGD
jgi:hypothetical protein